MDAIDCSDFGGQTTKKFNSKKESGELSLSKRAYDPTGGRNLVSRTWG